MLADFFSILLGACLTLPS